MEARGSGRASPAPVAFIQSDSIIGRHSILNTACSVDHDASIGDFAHVAPGAHLAGGVRVGEGALLGIGCSVLPGCTVGDWAIVGAGGVVLTRCPTRCHGKGCPGQIQWLLTGEARGSAD